ncbi:cyclic AMP-dependent transcription factor ATF-6 alpha isoform X2 [Gouania willdenowi]|uniref:BZIP domain-containing protein n=1 Tax=Gouania willdenowi TaxID=441366 RepID=A0A8C5D2H5_GOUWI|nr:cyclic AMP-dependent transcription factor ATF-6 alpha isoform X2 [Gouania willdenowi]
MASQLMLDNRSGEQTGDMSIDQGGEWDISLFDELDNLGEAQDLFDALENVRFANDCPGMDFDIDIPSWIEMDTSSTCTDGDMSADSLSPAHTLSSVSSPASIEALSPCSLQEEALNLPSLLSPVSPCSDSSGFSEVSLPAEKPAKRPSPTTRVKPAQPIRRPIQTAPQITIQPKPLITAVSLAQTAAPLQTKTIIIQPLQTSVLPVIKQAPINIQPAPPPGCPIVLSQPSQFLQVHTPQNIPGNVVAMPTFTQERPVPATAASPVVSVTIRTSSSDDDSKLSQKQQRMIKNRESASLSRKKKKDYLLSLEARLKMAMTENEALKSENGNLKRQLEGLLSQNNVLKATAPKRRAVCLMVVLVFLVINVGPMSLFQDGSKIEVPSTQPRRRHLLGFSPEAETDVAVGSETPRQGHPAMADSFSAEDKALMVVKDPVYLRPSPPCQPLNRTKCFEMVHELRGWVHRHEVQQTKSRRTSSTGHKPTRTIIKTENDGGSSAQITTVHYTATPEKRNPGSELQVYYAPQRTYSDFFDELNRRADTFYVISFRRDHLLLPATNHNKGRRPKMSVLLPAVNINDSVIQNEEFQVMMQIDCEVTDTRILHIRTSSIPPLLRVNHTDTFYQHSSTDSAAPPIGVLMGSA